MTQKSGLNWIKQKWSDFESFVEGVLYDRDLSISARLFGLFLNPFSYIFYSVVRIRLFLYSHNFFLRSTSLDSLVIVVGNLTMGELVKLLWLNAWLVNFKAKGEKLGC